MGDRWIIPTTLSGPVVQLEPVGPEHVDGLWQAAQDRSIWAWMPTAMEQKGEMEAHVRWQMDMAEQGIVQGWATRHVGTGEICGGTAYLNAVPASKRVEIGWTWLAEKWQRTGVNTGTKLLLMTHAFEVLGANRVEFKTDSANMQSRTAIARLGAKEEGILRHHMARPDGSRRDSVYFSVIREEWPGVRERLLALAGPRD